MSLSGNRIVDALPRADRARLLAASQTVALAPPQVLGEAGAATRHVYFPTGSCLVLLRQVDGHPNLAVGMIGGEGMLGVQRALGLQHDPLGSLVQAAGAALRIGTEPFADELRRSAALRNLLARCAHVQMMQCAHAVGCLCFHEIGPRLARWLLMSQDRAGGDVLQATHEFLAGMLGVRREGVTTAAGGLQRLGLIRCHRGTIGLLDRAGLMRAACSCYSADRRVLDAAMRATPLARPRAASPGVTVPR